MNYIFNTAVIRLRTPEIRKNEKKKKDWGEKINIYCIAR